ncbi:MAG: cysteine synthase family protein [Candidatus Methanoplasma sp.]|jgi:cysteine synthase A|nr:cysteine synthase family protein [Candidatus Methanoplasma sp.]
MLYDSMQGLVGNTPLVRLGNLGIKSGVNVYAKLELSNPSGSVKDRVGEYMVADAERSGILHPGSVIVEATAGNTGLGIAFAALSRGYRTIFVVPTKFSVEKLTLMHALGAEIVSTPYELGMLGAEEKAEELLDSIPDSVSLRQFRNPSNPRAHYETTGPEIYRDLEGVTHLVAGAGSGGTFTGIMRYLRERNGDVRGVLADPVGSIIGGGEKGSYCIEGIGNDFIADTMDVRYIDLVFKVHDEDAVKWSRELARKEGIFAGSSSGAALYAATELSKTIDAGEVVVILPDRGDRYFSKGLYAVPGADA